jgi:hypothetical protein
MMVRGLQEENADGLTKIRQLAHVRSFSASVNYDDISSFDQKPVEIPSSVVVTFLQSTEGQLLNFRHAIRLV